MHTAVSVWTVWNVSKCWHKIRKMLNAVCAFLRSSSLSPSPSLSRFAILLLAFYLWMAGAKKRNYQPFGCVACDACITTTTTTQSLVCVFFIILHSHSINSNSLNHRCQFDSGCPHAKLCVHHHLNDLNDEKKDRQTCTHIVQFSFLFKHETSVDVNRKYQVVKNKNETFTYVTYEKFFFIV